MKQMVIAAAAIAAIFASPSLSLADAGASAQYRCADAQNHDGSAINPNNNWCLPGGTR